MNDPSPGPGRTRKAKVRRRGASLGGIATLTLGSEDRP